MNGLERIRTSGRQRALACTIAIVLALATVACVRVGEAPDPEAPAIEQISMRTGWLHSGYDAGYFVAIDRGYYEEEGLEVTIHEGQGSVATMQAVAGGSDTFGFVDGGVLAVGVSRGFPVRMVAGIFQVNPQGVSVMADSGIESVVDLEGKRVAGVAGANTALLLPSFFEASGADPDQVTVVNTDPANLVAVFLSGETDAMTVLSNFQPQIIESQGYALRTFLFADAGINTLSTGLVAHADTIEQRPDLVERFTRATLRGLDFARNNPEEAIDIMLEYVDLDRDVSLGQLQATIPLLHTENSEGQPLGWMAAEDWEETQRVLIEIGLMEEAQPLEMLYTNEFVPGS